MSTPPARVGVAPVKNDSIGYIVGGIFGLLAVIVVSVTIVIWLKQLKKKSLAPHEFNANAGQAWKMEEQPVGAGAGPGAGKGKEVAYGDKAGHDTSEDQAHGLLSNAAEPGRLSLVPGQNPDRRSTSSYNPTCPVHSRDSGSSYGRPRSECPVHSSDHASGSRPRSRSRSRASYPPPTTYIVPPPESPTTARPLNFDDDPEDLANQSQWRPDAKDSSQLYNNSNNYTNTTRGSLNSNPYHAALSYGQQPATRMSIPSIQTPPPQYQSRPASAIGPPAALIPGPPTTPKPQHSFTNPYNHTRRPSTTGELLPLHLPAQSQSQPPTVMSPEADMFAQNAADIINRERQRRLSTATPPVLDLPNMNRGRERRSSMVSLHLTSGDMSTRPSELSALSALEPPPSRGRERRLSIGVPVIARTKSGRHAGSARREQSVDGRSRDGRLSVAAPGGGGGRDRSRSVSPSRLRHSSIANNDEDDDAGDLGAGESLLGKYEASWDEKEVRT